MSISPLDVRNQTFKKGLRGYDTEEVRIFLEAVADSMEETLKQKAGIENELNELRKKLSAYAEMENTLKEAVLTAQRICDEVRLSAEKEAANIIRSAELDSQAKVSEAYALVERIARTHSDLVSKTLGLLAQVRSMFESHLELLGVLEERLRKEVSTDIVGVTFQQQNPGQSV